MRGVTQKRRVADCLVEKNIAPSAFLRNLDCPVLRRDTSGKHVAIAVFPCNCETLYVRTRAASRDATYKENDIVLFLKISGLQI